MNPDPRDEFIRRLANQCKATWNLSSSLFPPDWEQIVEWWDGFVDEARELSGEKKNVDQSHKK